MPNRKAARFAVRFVVLGVAAGTLAGYSAYAKRPAPSGVSLASLDPQTSNSVAKTDRLALLAPVAQSDPLPDNKAGFALASAPQSGDLGRFNDMMSSPVPAAPLAAPTEAAAPAPAVAPAEPKQAALAPAPTPPPIPHEKPKRVAPPQATMFDDSQIAGLKGRLHLTSDQAEYWPAVEEALRDVVRTQLRSTGKHGHGSGKMNIDVNSAEVQKLIWAAMPLLMRLREDQKGEVRKLARVIGLEQVASQI